MHTELLRNAAKFFFFVMTAFVLLFSFSGSSSLFAQEELPRTEETLEATVTRVVWEERVQEEGPAHLFQVVTLEVTKGSLLGKYIQAENGGIEASNVQEYKIGDRVLVVATKDYSGNDVFFIVDYIRRIPLLVLAAIFATAVILIGGIWGLMSLFGMVFSFAVIFLFILPQLLQGHDPIVIAVIGAAAIIPVTFYLSHGINIKTHVAIVGTLITLVFIGLFASVFVEFTHLSGFAAEEAGFLQSELLGKINIKGLLLAGIIISSLGILDDITISQASIIKELREANKKMSKIALFKSGMRVGRDHIASLVNTLVLVYAGASLPLLLLFVNNPHPFGEVINYEMIAEEIVKTLIGSIGLILAVPITTALAVFYFTKRS